AAARHGKAPRRKPPRRNSSAATRHRAHAAHRVAADATHLAHVARQAEGSLVSPLGDFAPQAKAYAARPGYPEALVDLVASRAGVKTGDRVADIGAGTGIFTRHLVAR